MEVNNDPRNPPLRGIRPLRLLLFLRVLHAHRMHSGKGWGMTEEQIEQIVKGVCNALPQGTAWSTVKVDVKDPGQIIGGIKRPEGWASSADRKKDQFREDVQVALLGLMTGKVEFETMEDLVSEAIKYAEEIERQLKEKGRI